MQPITSADLYEHRVLSSIDAVPDSDAFVLQLRRAHRGDDEYRKTLWVSEGGRLRRLTSWKQKAGSAKLSPDGTRVAFVSHARKDGTPEIHVQDLQQRESRVVGGPIDTLQSIGAWSPDGRRLLLMHKMPFREDELDDADRGEQRPRVATHLPYKRDGAGIRVGYREHCDVLELATGTRTPLLSGDFDVHQAAWSPDGTRLAYIRTRDGTQRHFTDLWLADADGGSARRVTSTFAAVNGVSWSPDGRTLALAASVIEGDSISELWYLDAAGGEPWRATDGEVQLEGAIPAWHPDSSRCAVLVSHRGLMRIGVFDVAQRTVTTMPRGLSHVMSLKATRDGLVFVDSTMRRLCEVHRCDWEGGSKRRLTRFNRRWFATRSRPRTRVRWISVPDGRGGEERIQVWLLQPPGEGPFPVYYDMHGGPQSTVLIDFAQHAYWYELVSRGVLVVAPNAVGSGSFGFEFARRLRGRWGELDLPQYLKVHETLRSEGLVTDDEASCGGKSYGGFLSAWALGHSDLYRAAVVSAPVANVESHTGTSDSGYYVGPYAMDAEFASARDRYRRQSPLDRIATGRPTQVLLLQGEEDERCPLGQAEELFAQLVRSDRPATLVVYPGGSHSMAAEGKPSHRLDYHRRFADWVIRHGTMRGAGASANDEVGDVSRQDPHGDVRAA